MIIEKGIQIPQARISHRKPKEWEKMEVGDSILLPTRAKAISTTTRMRDYSKKNNLGWAITTRVVGDGQVRLWRIK